MIGLVVFLMATLVFGPIVNSEETFVQNQKATLTKVSFSPKNPREPIKFYNDVEGEPNSYYVPVNLETLTLGGYDDHVNPWFDSYAWTDPEGTGG